VGLKINKSLQRTVYSEQENLKLKAGSPKPSRLRRAYSAEAVSAAKAGSSYVARTKAESQNLKLSGGYDVFGHPIFSYFLLDISAIPEVGYIAFCGFINPNRRSGNTI
jgi:hypothetical protein